MKCVDYLVIFVLVVLPAAYFSWAAFQLNRNGKKIKSAWVAIGDANRYFIKVGFVLLLPVPVLHDWLSTDLDKPLIYVVTYFLAFCPAVATGFLVSGLISYSREMIKLKQ